MGIYFLSLEGQGGEIFNWKSLTFYVDKLLQNHLLSQESEL